MIENHKGHKAKYCTLIPGDSYTYFAAVPHLLFLFGMSYQHKLHSSQNISDRSCGLKEISIFVYNPPQSMLFFLKYEVIERIRNISKIIYDFGITKYNRCYSGEYKILRAIAPKQ